MEASDLTILSDACAGARSSVLIIGGTGGMGAWLATNLFLAEGGTNVTIADVEVPERPPCDRTFLAIDYDDGASGLPDLSGFGLVVVAVPRDQVSLVAERILPRIAPGALVCDIVSLKVEPLEIMEAALPTGVGLIGTHPLFGYAVPSLVGQTVVLCPTSKTTPADLQWLRALLARHGATVQVMTAAEHDEAMAIVQALTHYTAWTVASALRDTQVDLRKALALLTPPFRALAGLVGRIADIPDAPPNGVGARMFADIQTAGYPDAQRLREAFVEAATRLNQMAQAGDHAAWAREAESVAGHFPAELLDTCKQLFAQSHASAQADAVKLYEHRLAEKACAFRSTARGRVVAGRILDFSPASVRIEVCSASAIGKDGRVVYGLAEDDESRAAVASLGLTVPRGRTEDLPRGDYKLLSDAEFERWKVDALLPHTRDVTLVIPTGIDGDGVVRSIARLTEGVLTSESVARYYPPDGSSPRWTARLRIRGDRLPRQVLATLEDALSAFSITIARPSERPAPR